MAGQDAMAAPDGADRESAAERAYVALREMAMVYRFAPGERLNEGTLAHALNVSRTPLREALNRLVSEGLVVADPGRGFRARPLDVKEVFDLYETRLALECFIAQLACERATSQGLDEIDAYLDESVKAHDSASVDRLVRLDEGFHERVAQLTGNGELARMLSGIDARIHFFRWVDMRGRRATTQAEHRAVLAAIRARNAPKARAVMRDHITRRLDQIVDGIRQGYASLYMGEGPASTDDDRETT
ncbi:GntR family transcriptional regulator [Kaustia mangrovi]|nr:GntR family transcriptional regulator [Kaustia mangrovi]